MTSDTERRLASAELNLSSAEGELARNALNTAAYLPALERASAALLALEEKPPVSAEFALRRLSASAERIRGMLDMAAKWGLGGSLCPPGALDEYAGDGSLRSSNRTAHLLQLKG